MGHSQMRPGVEAERLQERVHSDVDPDGWLGVVMLRMYFWKWNPKDLLANKM